VPPINLKILLPFQVFADESDVKRVVAHTLAGSFGILPHRLDCAAALAPGILTYETEADGEVFVAVDQGVLVKAGADVLVSVRHAIGGADLDDLQEEVQTQFLTVDEHEKTVRAVLSRMESGFIRRLMEFQNG
jgi:F-type H+-transporting ATPase subunit epsilon